MKITILTIIMLFLIHNYNEYNRETGRTDLQGAFEHIKKKYWYPKK